MKKYNAKYFGVTAGIFSVLLFILALIKMFFSKGGYSTYFKPFIPFFNSVNTVNIIGGIAVSFLWGWVIGYFFIVFYNWFDKKTNSI